TVRRAHGDARLAIAGRDGAVSALLHATVDALGLSEAVEFLGTRDDVPDLLCAADVFVFPSRWEGVPGGGIEAMALEVPVVASDIAPVREVLGGADIARLVRPDDPGALAVAISSVLDEPQCRPRTKAGRERFLEHFTIERVARQMRDFYGRAL